MEKTAQDIILKPIITEASMENLEKNKYTFKVAKTANKYEIKSAVEELFNVKVVKVNTLNVRGRKRRMGRYEGYTSSWKKAVVTLKDGEKTIEFFNNLV